jgi:hypothetical protein
VWKGAMSTCGVYDCHETKRIKLQFRGETNL